MKRQAFQRGEIRDENDNIISEGAYGKKTAFANKTNDGILDYIINNFQALFDMISGAYVYVDTLPSSGDSDKLYVVNSTGKTYRWDGKQFVFVSESVDGLSAYEIAKQNGFEGTEQEWIKSIVSDTIESAETDASGNLIFTMKSGGKIKTTLQPIVECINYMNLSKKWAVASESPDNESDTESGTGKTLSSKSWALASKIYASQAKKSETNATNSENNALQYKNAANDSKTAAATSASNASKSEVNAKASANAASTSASNAKLSETHASTSETNTKQALAEAQKIQKQIESDVATLTSAVKYKGSVNSFSDLPTKNAIGDMYNIKNAGGTDSNNTPIKAGDNVVWNGTGWDNQSGVVDLSDYTKSSEVSKTVIDTTCSGDTITLIHKDGTTSKATINNVLQATQADQDSNGNNIAETYYKKTDASTAHQSLQNQIANKQDKLTFDAAPTAGSTNPVTSDGVKTALESKVNMSDVVTSATANKILKLNSFGGLSANVNGLGTGNTINNRKSSANININDGALHYYLATGAMSAGKPPSDAMILHMAWDNGGWGRQVAFPAGNTEKEVAFYTRGANNKGVFDTEWTKVPTVNLVATQSGNGCMSKEDKIKLDSISNIYTFTKTLTLTTDWQDTGIHGTATSTGYDLPSGSYVVQISGMDSSATNLYGEIFTGLMSFYNYETNSENADEIILHKAGHASNNNNIYLRTLRHGRADKTGLTLQIKANIICKESKYIFKFKKLI